MDSHPPQDGTSRDPTSNVRAPSKSPTTRGRELPALRRPAGGAGDVGLHGGVECGAAAARVERAILGAAGAASALLGRRGGGRAGELQRRRTGGRRGRPAGRARRRNGLRGEASLIRGTSTRTLRRSRGFAQMFDLLPPAPLPTARIYPSPVRETSAVRHRSRRPARRPAHRADRLWRPQHGRRHVARQRRQARRAARRPGRERRAPGAGRTYEDRARRSARQGRRPQLLGLVVRPVPRRGADPRARAAAPAAHAATGRSSASRTRTSPTSRASSSAS